MTQVTYTCTHYSDGSARHAVLRLEAAEDAWGAEHVEALYRILKENGVEKTVKMLRDATDD